MSISSDDNWPKEYHSGPPGHMQAIGFITINYTIFEGALFGLFSHHLSCAGMPEHLIWKLYNGLSGNKRPKAIQDVFAQYEKDPEVILHINAIIDFYNICAGNRNLFAHAHDYRAMTEGVGQLMKILRDDWDKAHFLELDLPTLRAVADDMHRGFNYLWEVWAYLAYRDKGMGRQSFLASLWPRALPKKPQSPRNLSPLQILPKSG